MYLFILGSDCPATVPGEEKGLIHQTVLSTDQWFLLSQRACSSFQFRKDLKEKLIEITALMWMFVKKRS